MDWGVLALVSFLSVAVPLPGLGFYSDDWAFLAIAATLDPRDDGIYTSEYDCETR